MPTGAALLSVQVPPDREAQSAPAIAFSSPTSNGSLMGATAFSRSISMEEERTALYLSLNDPMDPVEHSRLQDDCQSLVSLGNLSSLEATSPCPLPSIMCYLQSLRLDIPQGENHLSPLLSDDELDTGFPVSSKAHSSKKEKQPHRLQLSNESSNSSPKKLKLACDLPSHSQHTQDSRKKDQIQTFMLQKMEQALEAMQAAYAYMPYISPESETPASNEDAAFNLANPPIQFSSEKLAVNKGDCSSPQQQEIMAKCFSKFLYHCVH